MKLSFAARLFGASLLFKLSLAQSTFPPQPAGLTEVISKKWPGASISYKETTICETTPGVKAWSGYVSLPESLLNKVPDLNVAYDVNLYFWFFEARNSAQTAQTSIYLGGGPGYTSLDPMSGFPCNINSDSNSTTLNEFSWNSDVNMLYIEQPVGTGFSFARLVNGTLTTTQATEAEGPIFKPLTDGQPLPETNASVMAATLDPRTPDTTQNRTIQAARTIWQFAQVWFQEFPEYTTTNKDLSFWGTSYGGYWTVGFVSYFLDQNALIESNRHPLSNAIQFPLATLGIANGCIDVKITAESYPQMAYNNTYGIQVYTKEQYDMIMENVTAPNVGCHDLLDVCRAAASELDPTGQGNNAKVNRLCLRASKVCFGIVLQSFMKTNRSPFDITYQRINSDVDNYYNGFFNQRWVQEDLGVRTNFTNNDYTYQTVMFTATSDAMIQDVSLLDHILENGVSVAMVYGDRDYQCNWIGAEKISLAMEYPDAPSFRSAGYADIVTNSSYNGGLVRQYGNVSFSRVFEAGHSVTAYQPQTLYEIFQRTMLGKDVATGQHPVDASYGTEGPLSSWNVKNDVARQSPLSVCYTYVATETCTKEQIAAIEDGSAEIHDFIVTKPPGTRLTEDSGNGLTTGPATNNSGPGGGGGGPRPNGAYRIAGHLLYSLVSATLPVVILTCFI